MQDSVNNGGIDVFVVSSQIEKDEFLAQTLVHNGLTVIISDSLEEVYFDIIKNKPKLILLRSPSTQADDILINKIKENTPNSIFRKFNTINELINPLPELKNLSNLSFANLHLLTMILSNITQGSSASTIQVGPLVEKLCKQLKLPAHDYLKTITAGYLQDISILYFKGKTVSDRETAFFKLLSLVEDNIIYPPSILNIIRRMYQDLSQIASSEQSKSDIRNSNIVTIIDFYLKYFPTIEKLTPYRFESIKEHLCAQKNIILLPEIVDSFLMMIKDDVIYHNSSSSSSYALVLDVLNNDTNLLPDILKSCGFDCNTVYTQDKLIKSYHKHKPNLLILVSNDTIDQIREGLDQIISKGVILSSMPTILIHKSDDYDNACSMLKFGLYDVIKFNGSYDILKIRLKRIQAEQENEARMRLNLLQEMGTHGSLSHMNVIDLLQAMGPSNKTLCINITGQESHLSIYLNKGKLVFAECDDKTGVDAIYKALSWNKGIWSVENVTSADLPESNVNRSIDSILIEGCHLLDEINHNNVDEKPSEFSIFS